jgi:hypothetical protein
MATNVCAQCGQTADTLEGWSKAIVQPASYDATAPTFPWVGDVPTEYLFHSDECRATWLERLG